MKWIGNQTLPIYASQITLCLLILLVIIPQTSRGEAQIPDCSRAQSRVARGLLQKDLYPVFKAGGWEFPQSCPLKPSRDMYSHQEERKWCDNINKWYCNYCGKAFTSENTLDAHFANRHSRTIVSGEDAVCLADHCDYLRCDIISGAKTGSYWDKTLCKQTALDRLKQRCETVIKSCLPEGLTGMHKHELRDKLKKALCSSLTCELFWEAPSKESTPHGTAAYAIVTCILIVGLLLYYLVAYTHFYTDSSLLNSEDTGVFNTKESEPHFTRDPYGNEIRNRYQQR
ncbi:uncharacterized protein [Asterias amurensis]|uniref:uncharacterized protein n=1 Tax=Asterias amurensis TaxID=7602 RepID=UPI003AB3ED39